MSRKKSHLNKKIKQKQKKKTQKKKKEYEHWTKPA